jgi:hypothetical protein
MTIDRPNASWVVKGALSASVALLLYLVWRSLRWPLIHDAALIDVRTLLPPNWRMQLIATIDDPAVIGRILAHLGPRARGTAPGRRAWALTEQPALLYSTL